MIEFVPAPATLPPQTRVYAVGDVHGCLDQLTALHAAIAADLVARPVADPLLLHIGDYIDRGPDSAQVIAWLRGPTKACPSPDNPPWRWSPAARRTG